MKFNKILKTTAIFALTAAGLSGCKFSGTTTDFKDRNHNSYQATWDRVGESGIITYTGLGSTVAKSNEVLTIKIVTRGELDEQSIIAAFDVFPLTKNSNAGYAPVRGETALPKSNSLKAVDVSYFTGGAGLGTSEWFDRTPGTWWNEDPGASGTITTIKFDVDTSSVTTDSVVLVADATKLKEKTGYLVLNGNDNEICGEDTDSLIKYFSISKKADKTTDTDPLGTFEYEDFAPTFDLSLDSIWIDTDGDGWNDTEVPDINYVVEDGKQTGKLIYTVYAPSVGYNDGLGYKVIYADKDAFIEALNNMYLFRSLPAGASTWSETPLVWKEGDDNHTYTAEAVVAYGTKFCIATKQNNKLEWAAIKDIYGGHIPRLSWKKDRNEYGYVSTYEYIKDEPSYIVDTPDNSESAVVTPFAGGNYSLNAIKTVQDNILDVEKNHDGYFIVKISNSYENLNIRLSSLNGFVVTDNKNNIIKTKTPVVYSKDDNGGIISVLIEFEDKNRSTSNFKYWVGEKTTISGNKKCNDKQIMFGTPAVEKENNLTGYVQIN